MSHEPKKRHSRARQGKRRSAIHLEMRSFLSCPNCQSAMLPHSVCRKCGFYNGKQVLAIKKNSPETVAKEKAA